MKPVRSNFFAGPYIDRRTEAREASDWLAAALADPHTQFLMCRGTDMPLLAGEPRIGFVPGRHPAVAAAEPDRCVLLGWFRERRCVLLELDPAAEPLALPADAQFHELRALSPQLGADEAGLLAYARALVVWRSRQRHCGICGARTAPGRAGHSLRCTNGQCAQEYFPRLDPAIIVLVTDGERALLGRQAAWPPGRYSTIAGFVEPGESLEDAVGREVLEETGIRVLDCRYDSSQPWPFPASLMIGFRALAAPGAVCVGGELEDARWFTPEELRSDGMTLPPAHSISRRLIEAWLAECP